MTQAQIFILLLVFVGVWSVYQGIFSRRHQISYREHLEPILRSQGLQFVSATWPGPFKVGPFPKFEVKPMRGVHIEGFEAQYSEIRIVTFKDSEGRTYDVWAMLEFESFRFKRVRWRSANADKLPQSAIDLLEAHDGGNRYIRWRSEDAQSLPQLANELLEVLFGGIWYNSQETRTPLETGSIIRESFSILFGQLVPILLVGILILLPVAIIAYPLFLLRPVAFQDAVERIDSSETLVPILLVDLTQGLVGLLALGTFFSAITLLAYDAKSGRPLRFADYPRAVLRVVFAASAVCFILSAMVGVGLYLLIVPGVWLAAVFSVAIPAVVIERTGFRAFSQSSVLTEGYRWPIAGLFLMTYLLSVIWLVLIFSGLSGLGFVVMPVLWALMPYTMEAESEVDIFTMIFSSAFSTLLYAPPCGLIAVTSFLIYARLNEIKHGKSIDSIADPVG